MKKLKKLKKIKGIVISNKMNKTCVVKVTRQLKHPIYGKYIKRTTKLHVHDEYNSCKINDIVELVACKPISKTKFWRIIKPKII